MPNPLINPNPQTGWRYGNYCFYYDYARNKIVRAKIYGTGRYDATLRIPGLNYTVDDVPFAELFMTENDAHKALNAVDNATNNISPVNGDGDVTISIT